MLGFCALAAAAIFGFFAVALLRPMFSDKLNKALRDAK
jgi:hypothetical protein